MQRSQSMPADLSETEASPIATGARPQGIAHSQIAGAETTATGVYVTIHGHFYQPPRENPSLGAIERQSGAAPFHDWNERIHHECYRPNAFARVFNDQGEVVDIVNNFEYLSFNIGPTLMSWLERYDPEVYQRILAADQRSCERLGGHGNAIAQVYNHIILPLANHRDKVTQVRWGKTDFRQRFGRDPEGMWLAEAAVDYATLEVLIAEGIKFIILAPSQAQRRRPIPPGTEHTSAHPWQEVGGGQIDPIRPYRCFLPDGDRSRDYIDIFFYDGPISRDMGFDDLLSSSWHLVGRLAQAVRGDQHQTQLISVATDGETFGHHKSGTEKALAYAFIEAFPRKGWQVTNYAHYLSLHPPTWEVELKSVTAWSCAHGVDRWQANCGCGGEGSTWHQKWRRPLRDALDWLRDQLSDIFVDLGETLFQDPWQARNDYIQVINQSPALLWAPDQDLDAHPTLEFLRQHQQHELTPTEQVDALRLLELQRQALLMYTSCGWFFAEISRPEGTQILRYAARAISLAAEVAGQDLEAGFLERLAMAPSNVNLFQTGQGVYEKLVRPSQVSLRQVAAHYAMNSLFETYPTQQRLYCYQVQQLDYQLQRMGALTLAVGQVRLTSEVTFESEHLVFGVLHLGGQDLHCGVQTFAGRKSYAELKDHLFTALQSASAAQAVLAIHAALGPQFYGLQDLFPDERQRLMGLLTERTLNRLDQLYTQVYRDNYGVLMAYQQDNLEVPQALLMAAQIALSHRAQAALQALEQEMSDLSDDSLQESEHYFRELDAIASEAQHLGCTLTIERAQPFIEELILRLLWQVFHESDPQSSDRFLAPLNQLIDLVAKLGLALPLEHAQELYFKQFHTRLIPACQTLSQTHTSQQEIGTTMPNSHAALSLEPSSSLETLRAPSPNTATIPKVQLRQLLRLGQKLAVSVEPWLTQLS